MRLQNYRPARCNVGIRKGSSVSVKGVETVEVEGPHPAANVGVQINHIKPINKGEVVWTVNPADVIVIGRLFNKASPISAAWL